MAGHGQLATEIRTRLEVIDGFGGKQRPLDKLDELLFRKPVRQHVREFAALFALIFNIIAASMLMKSGAVLSTPLALSLVSIPLYFVGVYYPTLLHPVWDAWMKFAHVLGTVMTTFILAVAWTIALIPLGLLLRVCRVKVMDTTFREPVDTYWEARDAKHDDFKLLERQF